MDTKTIPVGCQCGCHSLLCCMLLMPIDFRVTVNLDMSGLLTIPKIYEDGCERIWCSLVSTLTADPGFNLAPGISGVEIIVVHDGLSSAGLTFVCGKNLGEAPDGFHGSFPSGWACRLRSPGSGWRHARSAPPCAVRRRILGRQRCDRGARACDRGSNGQLCEFTTNHFCPTFLIMFTRIRSPGIADQ
jgi:hypothetical protein